MILREKFINAGLMVPNRCPDYFDGLPAPSWKQPWHAQDPGLRMDAKGKEIARQRVEAEVHDMREDGVVPSYAARTL